MTRTRPQWRAEPYPNGKPEECWRVVRGVGASRRDVWGYYPTRERAESAAAFANQGRRGRA